MHYRVWKCVSVGRPVFLSALTHHCAEQSGSFLGCSEFFKYFLCKTKVQECLRYLHSWVQSMPQREREAIWPEWQQTTRRAMISSLSLSPHPPFPLSIVSLSPTPSSGPLFSFPCSLISFLFCYLSCLFSLSSCSVFHVLLSFLLPF